MRTRVLVACWIVLLAPIAWTGESILYSITDNTVLYPATNRPVPVSVTESKTEIFALDPETGKKRLVFSDATARLQLMTRGGKSIAAAGGRIFAVAVDRQHLATIREARARSMSFPRMGQAR